MLGILVSRTTFFMQVDESEVRSSWCSPANGSDAEVGETQLLFKTVCVQCFTLPSLFFQTDWDMIRYFEVEEHSGEHQIQLLCR